MIGRMAEKDQRGVEIRVVIDFWKVSTIVLLLLSLFLVFYYGVFNSSHVASPSSKGSPLRDDVIKKVKSFTENYLLNGGVVEITNVTEISGLYRIELKVGNQTNYIFATPDARYVFLPVVSQGNVYFQVIDVEKFKEIIERLKIEKLANSTTAS